MEPKMKTENEFLGSNKQLPLAMADANNVRFFSVISIGANKLEMQSATGEALFPLNNKGTSNTMARTHMCVCVYAHTRTHKHNNNELALLELGLHSASCCIEKYIYIHSHICMYIHRNIRKICVRILIISYVSNKLMFELEHPKLVHIEIHLKLPRTLRE